nr:hypothetical protein [Flavipsychrobacter sp.]
DGTSDIRGDLATPTSVWGPLRTTLVAGMNNILLASNPQDVFVPEIWPGYAGSPNGYANDIAGAGTMINFADINYAPGNLAQIVCKEMALSAGQIVVHNGSGFTPLPDVYYFWSIHTYLCYGRIRGWIGAEPDQGEMLGQVIFKEGEWACSYGIKKFSPTAAPTQAFNIWFQGAAGFVSSFRFCHYQVLGFSTFASAVSYANSKGIAAYGQTCEGIG